jgi:hypothetical protein
VEFEPSAFDAKVLVSLHGSQNSAGSSFHRGVEAGRLMALSENQRHAPAAVALHLEEVVAGVERLTDRRVGLRSLRRRGISHDRVPCVAFEPICLRSFASAAALRIITLSAQ